MNKRISRLLLAVIVFSSILSLSAGGVETIENCNELSFNSSSSEGNYTIPLFDPNLGNLVGVNLAVDFTVLQDFMIENEGPESQNVSVDSEVVLSITMPDSSSISVNTWSEPLIVDR